MSEIEVNGKEYRLAKLNAMTQFHVSRRIMPVLASMAGEGDVMTKILHAVGELTDEDSEYVIGKCLTGCLRKNGDTWAKVYNAGNFMFEDIGLGEIIRLTMATIEENLSDFFTGLRSISTSAGD